MDNKKVILAIDDNPQQLEVFKVLLKDQYDVQVESSAITAITFLGSHHVDLILLDIEMPNISGFQLLHDIREVPSKKDIPVIFVTGHTEEELLREAASKGVSDVLTKPVKQDILLASIEETFSGM